MNSLIKIFWFTWLAIFFAGITSAQIVFPDGTPTVNRYNIKVKTVEDVEKLYLQGFYGSEYYLADSAVVKNGVATFKRSKCNLPCGVYLLSVFDPSHTMSTPICELVINQDNKLTVTLTQHVDSASGYVINDIAIDGSPENDVLYSFRNRLMTVYTPNVREVCEEYLRTMPESFAAKYIMAAYGTYQMGRNTPEEDLAKDMQMIEDLDYSESRLLHTPVANFQSIDRWVMREDDSDSIIASMNNILQRCKNETVKNYYLKHFFTLMDIHDPVYDPVLVHLYDNYGHDWIEDGREGAIKRKIESLRRVLAGAKIPELISHDIDGEPHSTNDIKTKYTVIWFWDPDCDHCQAMTPVLHQMYTEHAEDYNFEVFAVEVNDDHDRWKQFSDEHNLWDWINLSTSNGEQNIDFIEYFDIMTTPVLLLVDNSNYHTIIARQMSLNELQKFFETEKGQLSIDRLEIRD